LIKNYAPSRTIDNIFGFEKAVVKWGYPHSLLVMVIYIISDNLGDSEGQPILPEPYRATEPRKMKI